MATDPIKRARELRKTIVSGEGLLVVDYSGTLQGDDTSKSIDLMPNVHTGEHVFRAKVNVKDIDRIAADQYGKEFFDVKEKTDTEIEEFIRGQDFDFPLWFKHHPDFSMKRVLDYNPPFILQVGGCNFHDGSKTGGCWYCFVDDSSNDGLVATGKTRLRKESILPSMMFARGRLEKIYQENGMDMSIKVLRMSGGEPTIALDYFLDLWREIGDSGADIVGQIDSNLSTGPLVRAFEEEGIFEPHTLEKLAEYPIKVLTAIKGVDPLNLRENVQSQTTMEDQLYSIREFLDAGFDIFPQMYNPSPATLESYLEKMDGEILNFSRRIHVGPLKLYGPNKARLAYRAKELGLDPKEFIGLIQKRWDFNYRVGCDILNDYLNKVHGVNYKEETRSDVVLG